MAKRFMVDYLYYKNGSQTRTRLSSSTMNLANPDATSETAVQAYLKKRHPGYEISIIDVSFE